MPKDSLNPLYCRRCKKEIDDDAQFCPYCGTDQSSPPEEIPPPAILNPPAVLPAQMPPLPPQYNQQVVMDKGSSGPGFLKSIGIGTGLAIGWGCCAPVVVVLLLAALATFSGCLATMNGSAQQKTGASQTR